MTSAMAGIIQANNAAMTSALQTLLTRMDDRVDAKLAENKADIDAKLAEKLAENKADADAQMAGVIKTLDQLVSGRALRKRTCIKRQYIAYPPDARRQTCRRCSGCCSTPRIRTPQKTKSSGFSSRLASTRSSA